MPPAQSNSLTFEAQFSNMTKGQFADLIEKNSEAMLARLAGKLEDISNHVAKPDKPYKPTAGSHGRINYGDRQVESDYDRESRERYWKSLGKKIRKGARV